MSEQIKRYDMQWDHCEMENVIVECDDGDYVAFHAHDMAISAKNSRIAELEAERTEWVEAYWKTQQQAEPKVDDFDAIRSIGIHQGIPDLVVGPPDSASPGWRTLRSASCAAKYAATHSEEGRECQHQRTHYSQHNGGEHVCSNCGESANDAQPARQVGVDDIACDRAYRNGLMAGFNYGINDDEDGYSKSFNAYQREIHQATAELRDAIAPAASKVNSSCYVQAVPEHCDRITWRGHYYGLPLLAPVASQVGGDELEQFEAWWGSTEVLKSKRGIAEDAWKARAALAPAAIVKKYNWNEIVGLVSEVLGCQYQRDPDFFIGHQMPGINFNSLSRIIDRVQHREVARLNRRAIPERLLERVASPWMDDEELTINRHVAINELRALLGKEGE